MKNIRKLLGLSALFFSAHALAEQYSLDSQVKLAELVFEGTVRDVVYRFAESGAEHRMPYTFVTFQVVSILKGRYDGPTLTLRFAGGLMEDGTIMTIPQIPLFDRGDHDVLMVIGNENYPCPLVGCRAGRYRYVQGLVVNENGQTIKLDPQGRLRLGETLDLEEINTHKISDSISFTDKEYNQQGEPVAVNINKIDRSFLPDPAGFTQHISERVQSQNSYDELENLPPFNSANSEKPFEDDIYGIPVAMKDEPLDEHIQEKEEEEAISVLNSPAADQYITLKVPQLIHATASTQPITNSLDVQLKKIILHQPKAPLNGCCF